MDELETTEARLNLNGKMASMGGLVVKRRNLTTKRGEMMCFLELEDLEGRYEVIVFPKTLSVYRDLIEEGSVLLVSGRISAREDEEAKLLADQVALLPSDEEYEVRKADFNARDHRKHASSRSHAHASSQQQAQAHAQSEYSPQIAQTQVESRPPTQLPTSAEDQALLAAGMHVQLRLNFSRQSDPSRWQRLESVLTKFKGRVALSIVGAPSAGVVLDNIEGFRVTIAPGFLEEISALCGSDAISFTV